MYPEIVWVRGPGNGISVPFSSPIKMKINVCGRKCIALVDSGCFRTIVNKVGQTWKKLSIDIVTISSRTRTCRFKPVNLCVGNGRAVVVDALVVLEDALGFDLLTTIDAIKALGGMSISLSEEVHFTQKSASVCTAVPVLLIEGKAPGKLQNCIAEYSLLM